MDEQRKIVVMWFYANTAAAVFKTFGAITA